jgi:hypothetical protein
MGFTVAMATSFVDSNLATRTEAEKSPPQNFWSTRTEGFHLRDRCDHRSTGRTSPGAGMDGWVLVF